MHQRMLCDFQALHQTHYSVGLSALMQQPYLYQGQGVGLYHYILELYRRLP